MLILERSLMQLRRDMDLSLERSRIMVVVKNYCSVGYVARIIARMIVRYIRAVDVVFPQSWCLG